MSVPLFISVVPGGDEYLLFVSLWNWTVMWPYSFKAAGERGDRQYSALHQGPGNGLLDCDHKVCLSLATQCPRQAGRQPPAVRLEGSLLAALLVGTELICVHSSPPLGRASTQATEPFRFWLAGLSSFLLLTCVLSLPLLLHPQRPLRGFPKAELEK